jgi:hypothetical protein
MTCDSKINLYGISTTLYRMVFHLIWWKHDLCTCELKSCYMLKVCLVVVAIFDFINLYKKLITAVSWEHHCLTEICKTFSWLILFHWINHYCFSWSEVKSIRNIFFFHFRLYTRYQKRTRLNFGTKLGMNCMFIEEFSK